jgi:hypothetical protein
MAVSSLVPSVALNGASAPVVQPSPPSHRVRFEQPTDPQHAEAVSQIFATADVHLWPTEAAAAEYGVARDAVTFAVWSEASSSSRPRVCRRSSSVIYTGVQR